MNSIRNKIYIKIRKIKQRINEYFLMKKSVNNIIMFAKRFYLCSVGYDDIYLGNKNLKRFKITILTCIVIWIITLYHLLLMISDDLWSTIDGPFLPEHFRIFMSFFVILFFYASILKTGFFLSEITHQTTKSPFKIFYFLMNNFKSKHKLNEKNYKKLALISRFIQIILLNYGAPICLILPILIFGEITISSELRISWIFHSILITAQFSYLVITIIIAYCVVFTYFSYFIMRFNQINHKIKQISIGKINKTKEMQLNQLNHEHNELSIEIHHMNLCLRVAAAAFFVSMAFVKIISLYLMMNLKNNLMVFLMRNLFMLLLIFVFALTYLLSMQIKSAHQSYKLIQTICCKHKMKIKFQLKVS